MCDEESSSKDEEVTSNEKTENENLLGGPSFFPPLYTQRYSFVKHILDKLQPESVVDFGCSECGIFRHLKEVVSLLRISLVDIDSETLEVNKQRIRPSCYDYLQKRKNPLHVQIFHGNATTFDVRLAGYDAVVMVEFIEHLYEEDLKNVIKMVFGCINPKFIIMTTPNYEFNELFPGPKRFRHYDHKFEWTRSEFQAWCDTICKTYEYGCEFYGIGEGPSDTKDLGCCSQAVVLTRSRDKQKYINDVKEASYSLVYESIFPHKETSYRPYEEVLESELTYILPFMSKCTDFYNDDDETEAYIPIEKLLQFKTIKHLCDDDQLRTFLRKKNFKLLKNSENKDCVVMELQSYKSGGLLYSDDDVIEEDTCTKDHDQMLNLTNLNIRKETTHRNTEAEELWA